MRSFASDRKELHASKCSLEYYSDHYYFLYEDNLEAGKWLQQAKRAFGNHFFLFYSSCVCAKLESSVGSTNTREISKERMKST